MIPTPEFIQIIKEHAPISKADLAEKCGWCGPAKHKKVDNKLKSAGRDYPIYEVERGVIDIL